MFTPSQYDFGLHWQLVIAVLRTTMFKKEDKSKAVIETSFTVRVFWRLYICQISSKYKRCLPRMEKMSIIAKNNKQILKRLLQLEITKLTSIGSIVHGWTTDAAVSHHYTKIPITEALKKIMHSIFWYILIMNNKLNKVTAWSHLKHCGTFLLTISVEDTNNWQPPWHFIRSNLVLNAYFMHFKRFFFTF